MATDKQRQHYVPKFYLRNFSIKNNGKQINVLNTKADLFISNAKLKTQASKLFFYGKDGHIENVLSNIESEISPLITSICKYKTGPAFNSEEHLRLLHFVILMSSRNPVASNEVIESGNQLRKIISKMTDGKTEIDPTIMSNQEQAIKIVLQQIAVATAVCNDLKLKILINRSSTPFIISDNPLIKYNQFLEQRKWPLSVTGYASIGLQLLLPVDPFTMLLFYDEHTYKIGDRKKTSLEINKSSDVDQLNLLHFLNCDSLIFANENVTEFYLKKLFNESKKFPKANKPKSRLMPLEIQTADQKIQDKVIHQTTTDCKINLNIERITITKKAKEYKLSTRAVQMRPGRSEMVDLLLGTKPTKYTFDQ
jgi:hypothetical protein